MLGINSETKPDCDYWPKMEIWLLSEAILLTLDENPYLPPKENRTCLPGYIDTSVRKDPRKSKKYLDRWRIAKSSIQRGTLKYIRAVNDDWADEIIDYKLDPFEFCRWAESKGYKIPSELKPGDTWQEPLQQDNGAYTYNPSTRLNILAYELAKSEYSTTKKAPSPKKLIELMGDAPDDTFGGKVFKSYNKQRGTIHWIDDDGKQKTTPLSTFQNVCSSIKKALLSS